MQVVGGVGALYKLSEGEAIPVGTFLSWSFEDESGQGVVEAEEIYLETWPVSPPLHCALFSGNLLLLGDNVGLPYFKDGRSLEKGDDFVRGEVCFVVGFLWNRIPGLTVGQWKKFVLEENQLAELLKIVTEARAKSGKGGLDPFELSFESKKEPL